MLDSRGWTVEVGEEKKELMQDGSRKWNMEHGQSC